MQPRARADGPVGELEEFVVFMPGDVSGVHRVAEVVLGLDQRRAREFEVSGEFCRAETAKSLGDRPWRAAGGAADLIAEFEISRRWRLGDKRIHAPLQLVGELPTIEILIALCDHDDDTRAKVAPNPEHPEPRTPNPERTLNLEPGTWNPECVLPHRDKGSLG